MFEDICLVCGKPLQDAGYASTFPLHTRFSLNDHSLVVELTAVMTVNPTTSPHLQYLPLAAHVRPQT